MRHVSKKCNDNIVLLTLEFEHLVAQNFLNKILSKCSLKLFRFLMQDLGVQHMVSKTITTTIICKATSKYLHDGIFLNTVVEKKF